MQEEQVEVFINQEGKLETKPLIRQAAITVDDELKREPECEKQTDDKLINQNVLNNIISFSSGIIIGVAGIITTAVLVKK